LELALSRERKRRRGTLSDGSILGGEDFVTLNWIFYALRTLRDFLLISVNHRYGFSEMKYLFD
jgi:hypothetical protein